MNRPAALFLGMLLAHGALQAGEESAEPRPSAAANVVLEAATDHEIYRESARNEIYVEARIRVPVPAATGTATIPGQRNIALVLDRSGSMAGEPLQVLRKAALEHLGTLGNRDVISLVVFGSDVETLIEAQRVDQAASGFETQLARVEPSGGAALYDALNQGAAQLRRYAGTSTLNHLILVTDGAPTKGPREPDDFSRLAAVFASEGITVSTIGLGDDFDEDLLATIARLGNGRFHYADTVDDIPAALADEFAPLQQVIGHDAVVTIEFRNHFDEPEAHGSKPATITRRTVSYHFPHLLAGHDITVLASAEVQPLFVWGQLSDPIWVRLEWRDAASGAMHEEIRKLPLDFASDDWVVSRTINASVYRSIARSIISEAMEKSIGYIDKGDFRRAQRTLRAARGDAHALNVRLDDPLIDAEIQRLETYLAEVDARGMNQLDRKILRSGLFNQFEIPTADEDAGN